MLIAAYSLIAPEAQTVPVLLFAACCLLVSCAALLFSILTLLFYLGTSLTRDDETPAA
jgi:hypothetical protein